MDRILCRGFILIALVCCIHADALNESQMKTFKIIPLIVNDAEFQALKLDEKLSVLFEVIKILQKQSGMEINYDFNKSGKSMLDILRY
jgi:hypothetical protein